MSRVKIKTLTPVHIGSGNMLQNNLDFVKIDQGKESDIYIINQKEILNLIGIDQINKWITSIEQEEPILNLIGKYKPATYSQRRITNFCRQIQKKETLKETIHDGMMRPYIPGSSIKGAIRTAFLAAYASKVSDKEMKIHSRKNISAEQIEEELFGKDPNHDIFRFLHVGDCYFETNSTISTRMINLNITRGTSLIDKTKSQLIEAIGSNEESFSQIRLKADYYNSVKSTSNGEWSSFPQELQSFAELFELINAHTKQLLTDEIRIWSDIDKSGAEDYLDLIQVLLEEIEKCTQEKNSCVLGVGYASGWRFITGAWAESLKNFDSKVVENARRKNWAYKEYNFPKTRRIDEDSDILGFIKLFF